MKNLNYKHTITACFIGYIVQAITCNFAPLLFVSWSNEFSVSMTQITAIITMTFFIQIIVDLVSAKFVDKIGYKICLIFAHIFSCSGFIALSILPYAMKNPMTGIVISVILYSTGSGLLEVLVSPVVESCPTDNKAGAMSLLHSFYCWGTVLVIGVSSAYFALFGRDNWKYIALLWAAVSLANAVFFCLVPVKEPDSAEKAVKISDLFKNKFFIIAIIIMICSGASELAMSQWASTFAEKGLGVSKTVGDLAGPMAFAVLMGAGRVIFSKLSSKIRIEKYLAASAVLCIISYFTASLSPSPVVSLIGCALCGLAVSAMWPGTISLSSQRIPAGGTAMFAFLAFAGDVGCTTGPTFIGFISTAQNGDVKKGLTFGFIFPLIIILMLFLIKPLSKKSQ
ncbi:MAG: MFS transporter [Eubacterium sp.]